MFVYNNYIYNIYYIYNHHSKKVYLIVKPSLRLNTEKKLWGKNKETINHHNPLRHSNITGHVTFL